MKFRYYITDLHRGCVVGSNNPEDAEALRHSEDHFVVDTETNKWLAGYADIPVQELE